VIQLLAGRKKLWREALKTYSSDLLAYGLRPNVYTFNILCTACEKSGRWEEALKVFEGMENYNVVGVRV
jgi:pentatricopeptide repeat protein